jgi:light-regulated signal transduction histidine kinase (bacteriophytochrome)
MNDLIEDLLSLSRLSITEFRTEPVDLSQMARDILSGLQEQEPARAVHIQVMDGLVANGDPTLLQAVMQNLLGNAWKFSSRRDQASIQFGARASNEHGLVYFVRDNGAGFNMDKAVNLFSPFQRFHSKSEFPGTGIGLASVQRAIQRHGGELWAESQEGQGATFFFTIPGRISELSVNLLNKEEINQTKPVRQSASSYLS